MALSMATRVLTPISEVITLPIPARGPPCIGLKQLSISPQFQEPARHGCMDSTGLADVVLRYNDDSPKNKHPPQN